MVFPQKLVITLSFTMQAFEQISCSKVTSCYQIKLPTLADYSTADYSILFSKIYLHARASAIWVTFAKCAVFGIPRHRMLWACLHSCDKH